MKEIMASVALLTLAGGCNSLHHAERSYTNGELDFEWETRAHTFLAVKQIEYRIGLQEETATLSGKGISDNAREVALAQIAIEPELASEIIKAFRPGGQLEGAMSDLVTSDPDLAAAITEALADE